MKSPKKITPVKPKKPIIELKKLQQVDDIGCSEATVEMVMDYYGFLDGLDRKELYELENIENMETFINKYIPAKLKGDGDLTALKNSLDKGVPAIIRIVPFGQESRHAIVGIGIDDKKFYYNDPNDLKDVSSIPIDKFLKVWNRADRIWIDFS